MFYVCIVLGTRIGESVYQLVLSYILFLCLDLMTVMKSIGVLLAV